jgi:kynurenine formamidase
MKLVDLSRELFHKCPTHPKHPPFIMTDYNTHKEIRTDGAVPFSAHSMVLSMGDHTGTHVDAFCHFDARPGARSIDEMPLEDFFTEAVCLDLSHTPLKGDIHIPDLEAAERKAGIDIRPRDTVLIYMGVHDRLYGKPEYTSDFPGLTKESAEWLGHKKIVAFGVEAISPGRPGTNNYLVHLVCRDMGFTHYEGLANLHQVVGKGRFKFVAFPLRIRGGTGSPVRAVAILDE